MTIVRAARSERLAAASSLALVLSWLVYTLFYFWLQPRHLTYDGPFMYLTGKPDPACGLTRTFAWMWRGDLAHAAGVYPLGPLIFVGALLFALYSATSIISGRALRVSLSPAAWRGIIIGGLVALAMNWVAKLFWLGM